MKKFITISIIALSALSCSLDEKMDGYATRENAYGTFSQAQAVVNNCYRYTSFITTNFGLMAEACTDIWFCNTSTVDASLKISPSQPGVGSAVWNNCYSAIACCNEAIECIVNRSGLAEAEKAQLQAEARALRALYYYFLTNTFDGVPFYLEMVEDRDTQDRIQKLPRTPANEIRKALYEDLRTNALPVFTKESGLRARPSEIKGNRAGYALSLMLMAKFAMWYGNWNEALEPLLELEELYGTLDESSYPLEDTKWSVKNTAESIFEIQHAWSTTGVQYSSSYGRLTLPSYDGDSWFNGVYMPELGTSLASWAALRANYHYAACRPAQQSDGSVPRLSSDPQFTETIFGGLPMSLTNEYLSGDGRYAVTIDPDKFPLCDRRASFVLGLGKNSTAETFSSVRRGMNTFAGPKLWCYGMVSSYDSNNYKILRYADAVLMIAECYAMKGDLSRAVKYLNCTRVRAGLEPLQTTSDMPGFLQELRDERARELGGELHRKYDLVRWGIWYEETYKWSNSTALKSNMRPCHQYYPIPDTECALSGYILTNDAYSEN